MYNLNSSHPYGEYIKMVTICAVDTSFIVYSSIISWNCTILYCSTFQNRNYLVTYLFPWGFTKFHIWLILHDLNILRIGTKLVNFLICNQQIVVSITFLIVSRLNMDILTRFRTVRLAEQIINWSDYGNCINVNCNSPVTRVRQYVLV